jgi:lipopolysaccharide/colanic/teichoic acid biosynthesis glycosyltransferase
MSSTWQRAVKRIVDAAGAAVLLVVLSPLLLAIGLAVKASSPGEVIFHQRRVGRGGRVFTIYKFRTMVRDAPRSPLGTYCYADDPRVTPLGRLLRATSLDELPQLVNVLAGDMSFVGPRPDLPQHVERYSAAQRRRLDVRPGITGWAQVNGRNGIPWEERIALDLDYLDRWSLALDARVVARTIAVVATRRGAALPRRLDARAARPDALETPGRAREPGGRG